MLFIAGLVISTARAFAGMAVAGVVIALLCGFGLLPFDCRLWLAISAVIWLVAIHILILRQYDFKPPINDMERGYRNSMRTGALVGVGLALLLSFKLAPWIGSFAATS